MKAFLLPCALFLALLLLVAGTSAEDLPQAAHESAIEEPSGPQVRITCDLASWGGFNHALCAAHCLFKGYKGGYCNDKAVCVCRN